MNKDNIRRILSYLKKYRIRLIVTILLSAVYVVLTLVLPRIAGAAIDCIDRRAGGIAQTGGYTLSGLLTAFLICAAAAAGIRFVMSLINSSLSSRILHDIRRDAFDHLQDVDLSYIDSHPAGDLVSRITTDADRFADGVLMALTQLFVGAATILGAFISMVQVSLRAGLLVAALTPISMFIAKFIATHTYDMSLKQSRTRGEQTAFVNEMMTDQSVVRAFSHEKAQLERFDEINDRLTDCAVQAIFFSSLTNPTARFMNNLIYAVVALVGAYFCMGAEGAFTVGTLTAMLSYVTQYTKPFNEISGVITELQSSAAAAQRLFELIDVPSQIPDKDMELPVIGGEIGINDVSFSYDKSKDLLQHVDLQVSKGQRIAIVGPTGCGKTTLINLLMRFYDTDEGSITADGVDIRDCTRRSLRHNIGMVLQDTWLRHGTIRENIIMGKPDATDEEIVAAAKASHAHSFIKRLPDGYDTVIGEDGGTLSQGQKQLLCITRVMLSPPPVLILDEATSSIDTRTEILINRAFNKLMQGRTSFIVAHRLSTVMNADVILVMRDGNIIEQGTHAQLLEKGGAYAELFNSQFAVV